MPLVWIALGLGGLWLALAKKGEPMTISVLLQTPAALPLNVDVKPQLFAALFANCGAKLVTSFLTAPQPGRYVYTVTLDRPCPLPVQGTTVPLAYGRQRVPATVMTAQVAPVAVK
jgi:hypothetical protein